jgi:hypothetical protein
MRICRSDRHGTLWGAISGGIGGILSGYLLSFLQFLRKFAPIEAFLFPSLLLVVLNKYSSMEDPEDLKIKVVIKTHDLFPVQEFLITHMIMV